MAKDRTQLLLHEPNLYKAFTILALHTSKQFLTT